MWSKEPQSQTRRITEGTARRSSSPTLCSSRIGWSKVAQDYVQLGCEPLHKLSGQCASVFNQSLLQRQSKNIPVTVGFF